MKKLIEELGRELGQPEVNIRKWRSRGFVPHKYRAPMIAAAAKRGKKLRLPDFEFASVSQLKAHQAECRTAA